jgi:hypothetical protein
MEWIKDLAIFLFFPACIILIAILTYKGAANNYKIVRVTNTLGEEKYEVYFQYERMDCSGLNWRLEETFATEQLADEFIARQFSKREVIREGKLKQ